MERVQRWREPAVVVVVVVLLVRLALAAALAVGAVRLGENRAPVAAELANRHLGDPAPYVVLALLVLACHLRPATAHARTLAALALGVSAVGLALVLGLAVYGQPGSTGPLGQLELADRLASAVVPLLAVLLMGLLAARPRQASVEEPALTEQATEAEPEPALPAPDPALQPTWAPDAASGAAWTTAGDAASGRPASGWGTPAGTGWEAPGPAPVPSPERSLPDQGDRPSDPEGHSGVARPRP
jgi:hypothetical protein